MKAERLKTLRIGLFFGVAAALGHIGRATNMVDIIDWGRRGR